MHVSICLIVAGSCFPKIFVFMTLRVQGRAQSGTCLTMLTKKFATFQILPGFALHMTITIGRANGTRMFFAVMAFGLLLATAIDAAPADRHPRVRQVNRRAERQQ